MTASRILAAVIAASIVPSAFAQGEPEVIDQIVEEGRERSQVWETLEYISEEIGPRLTGSSNVYRANTWARDQFVDMGLDSWLFKWGDIAVGFDRGPSTVRMVEPLELDFEFTTRRWAAGTDGPVRGPVVKEPQTLDDLESVRDQLEGAWVLSKGRGRGRRGVVPEGATPEMREEIAAALSSAGIAGRLVAARGELVSTGGSSGWRDLTMDTLPTDVSITIRRSDYDSINSRLADGEDVVIEANLRHHFNEGPIPVYNTIAEIRGTEKPEEVVIVSAHLDSWNGPGSMGTQDNGTGSSVTIEAARILTTVGVEPKRTIRFVLWTGEEQGLLGSRGYVESLSEEEMSKISAVFVDDGGTNFQGGLVCVEEMADMLGAATDAVNEAFPELPVELVVRERMPRGGGSDHASFNRAGVPGFFWVEEGSGGREGKDYRYVWHTQNDTPRYAVPEYLVQSATCSAVTAYNLAMADTLLPRYVEPEEPETEATDEEPLESWTLVDGPLSGTWIGRPTGRDAPDFTFTMTFEMNDAGAARGTYESRRGKGRLSDVVFDKDTNVVTGAYRSGEMDMGIRATVAGDEMTGTIGTDDWDFDFKATRQNPEPAGDDVAKAETSDLTEAPGGATDD